MKIRDPDSLMYHFPPFKVTSITIWFLVFLTSHRGLIKGGENINRVKLVGKKIAEAETIAAKI